jgi:hypothetical protein
MLITGPVGTAVDELDVDVDVIVEDVDVEVRVELVLELDTELEALGVCELPREGSVIGIRYRVESAKMLMKAPVPPHIHCVLPLQGVLH